MLLINPDPIYTYKYSADDIRPIVIESVIDISNHEKTELLERYNNAGFVIYDLSNVVNSQHVVLEIAKLFHLDEPIVPKNYNPKQGLYRDTGLNTIQAQNGFHRAFQTNNEQKLHCDGTVEVINKIKTTILHCVKSASSGGETLIFNSVGAFHSLLREPQSAQIVSSMLDHSALRRISSEGIEYIGPAFQIENGEIISRFSLDNTCDWEYGFNRVDFLKEAYSLLTEKSIPSSPYFIETILKDNQGIIMANNKISHGRKEFFDTEIKREMVRGLFINSLYNKNTKTE